MTQSKSDGVDREDVRSAHLSTASLQAPVTSAAEGFDAATIEAAVSWWCGALGRPKYDALGPRRNDDMTSREYREEREERKPMEMASLMMMAYGVKLTPEQIETFAAHLREVLAGKCEHTWEYEGRGDVVDVYRYTSQVGRHTYLGVDYGPDAILGHCGELAGFPRGFFWPIKTSMWIEPGHVSVRYGYGAEIQYIHGDKKGA